MGNWIFWTFLLLSCILSGIQPHSEYTSTAEELRERYSVGYIVRDREHIKKDIGAVINLMKVGEITHYEAMFYYVRMHDFDDNRKLDGLELLVSFQHESGLAEENITLLEAGVDQSLAQHDLDNDGFLDFPEFVMSVKP